MKKAVIMQICMEGRIMGVSLLKGVPLQPYSIYRDMIAIVKDSINNLLQSLEGYQAVTSNLIVGQWHGRSIEPKNWKILPTHAL